MNESTPKTGSSMRILLDTNGYSALFNNDEAIIEIIEEADTVFMSVVVVGEALVGFKNGKRETKNKKLLEEFIAKPATKIISVTLETAEIYSQIKYQADKHGKPLPINDIWIAAHAIETGSILISYDRHFLKIPGLRLWDELTMRN